MTRFDFAYRMEGRKVLPCRDEKEFIEAITNRWGVKTRVGGDVVSTVFLCLDQNYILGGNPLVFETMVFPACEICVRYFTFEEAIAGHNSVVKDLTRKKWETDNADQKYQRKLGGRRRVHRNQKRRLRTMVRERS